MPHVDPDVAETNQRVAAESERFRSALPSLLEDPDLRGRWVVFRDGVVVSAFDDHEEARADALARFGRFGGFVVAPVEPVRVHRLGVASARSGRR